MVFAVWLCGAYLVGSLSFALLCSKWLSLPDPREQGSHNPGATNVLRTGGKKAAMLTLIGDMLKGALVVFAAKWSGVAINQLGWIGFATVLGHAFPVYHRFKGGKGVATTIGILLAATPVIGAVAVVLWVVIVKATRYSSLAALVSIGLSPVQSWFLAPEIAPAYMLLALVVFHRHRENITRLQTGTENKV
jgi:glycerol-3-phosphate acyltransferase PlsY